MKPLWARFPLSGRRRRTLGDLRSKQERLRIQLDAMEKRLQGMQPKGQAW